MIDPVALLQQLIRIDTTNPPGNETPAALLLADVLSNEGLEPEIYAKSPDRANLVVRIAGTGEAPPLLMHAHLDVVSTVDQDWERDPFGAEIVDGYLWGRGTLDMKVGAVMYADAIVRAHHADTPPAGDIIFCALADEENGGEYGARFLVEQHPEIFADVKYAIGEFGGFPKILAGKRFRPIQIAERIPVRFEVTVTGPSGHGSLRVRGGTTAKLGAVLQALDSEKLPVHVTDATRIMLGALIANSSGATKLALQCLLVPATAGPALTVLKDLAAFEGLLRNTASPTIIRAGDKLNVHPAKASVILDGRMLPGCTPEEMQAEIEAVVGPDATVTFTTEGHPTNRPIDMALFPTLAAVLVDSYPDSIPIPFLLPAVTDGRWFGTLGIQHYGFMPLDMPDEFSFTELVHAANERVPVAAVAKGADAVFDLIQRYRG
jgi:acetylornithine deacetylase/succinyl-diaminopimelate desuccinylase-like protein